MAEVKKYLAVITLDREPDNNTPAHSVYAKVVEIEVGKESQYESIVANDWLEEVDSEEGEDVNVQVFPIDEMTDEEVLIEEIW